jgi:hypothetical protein
MINVGKEGLEKRKCHNLKWLYMKRNGKVYLLLGNERATAMQVKLL